MSLWILFSMAYKKTLSSSSQLLVGLSLNSVAALTDLLLLHTHAKWFSFLHFEHALPLSGQTWLGEYIPPQK